MFSQKGHSFTVIPGLRLHLGTAALALCLSFFLTGCTSHLNKHAAALSAATAPVVDEATAAYRDAEAAYELGSDYEAVTEFDVTQPVYNPRTVKVLLTDQQIQDRLAVLAAFQLYVKDLVAITTRTDSPALDEASKSLGGNLTMIGNTLGPSIQGVLGITPAAGPTTETTVSMVSGTTTITSTSSSSTPVPVISQGTQNILSTGLNALGQFLVYRTIEKDLPQKLEAMDPVVEQLCKLLASDADILQGEEHRIYDRIINQQTLFLRVNKDKLDPGVRNTEIMQLPKLGRQQQAADEKLNTLKAAILKLYLTHHAFAADAQKNNPASLTQDLGELKAAGQSLGKFYLSLPSQ